MQNLIQNPDPLTQLNPDSRHLYKNKTCPPELSLLSKQFLTLRTLFRVCLILLFRNSYLNVVYFDSGRYRTGFSIIFELPVPYLLHRFPLQVGLPVLRIFYFSQWECAEQQETQQGAGAWGGGAQVRPLHPGSQGEGGGRWVQGPQTAAHDPGGDQAERSVHQAQCALSR